MKQFSGNSCVRAYVFSFNNDGVFDDNNKIGIDEWTISQELILYVWSQKIQTPVRLRGVLILPAIIPPTSPSSSHRSAIATDITALSYDCNYRRIATGESDGMVLALPVHRWFGH
uniref:Uncharacterized protein n=1 Tax=Spongospora subterranea TaxID=70186 RepID=A0A0H5RAK4_9EUKA|eukprot:CRZ05489.1 hypothetical protein [Spongospora subterranea]